RRFAPIPPTTAARWITMSARSPRSRVRTAWRSRKSHFELRGTMISAGAAPRSCLQTTRPRKPAPPLTRMRRSRNTLIAASPIHLGKQSLQSRAFQARDHILMEIRFYMVYPPPTFVMPVELDQDRRQVTNGVDKEAVVDAMHGDATRTVWEDGLRSM